MDPLEQKLREFMVTNGVTPTVAETAAQKCASAVKTNAFLGATVGFTLGMATSNPGSLIIAVVTGGFAGAGTLLGSPSCQEVRDAALKIAMRPN
jgi:hypothetical protein